MSSLVYSPCLVLLPPVVTKPPFDGDHRHFFPQLFEQQFALLGVFLSASLSAGRWIVSVVSKTLVVLSMARFTPLRDRRYMNMFMLEPILVLDPSPLKAQILESNTPLSLVVWVRIAQPRDMTISRLLSVCLAMAEATLWTISSFVFTLTCFPSMYLL
ncbi:hypothetical protein CRENBAI_008719 [Crenichthys baileyi]|uniref:Uncharacterized protein n=1 Tax=Crenichthys baileyi TaxID=28760 RepID=A0AAV9RMR0_9TELE